MVERFTHREGTMFISMFLLSLILYVVDSSPHLTCLNAFPLSMSTPKKLTGKTRYNYGMRYVLRGGGCHYWGLQTLNRVTRALLFIFPLDVSSSLSE